MHWSNITNTTKGAVICAILGFFISMSSTRNTVSDFGSTCSHMDFGALALGGLALLLGGAGLLATLMAKGAFTARWLNFALCDLAAMAGGYHVLRGLGLIGGPCA